LACFKTRSAACMPVAADAWGSTIIFNRVLAAALLACCSRARGLRDGRAARLPILLLELWRLLDAPSCHPRNPHRRAALSKLGCCSRAAINPSLCRVFFALRILAVKVSGMEACRSNAASAGR
jgi:hypothetical protein